MMTYLLKVGKSPKLESTNKYGYNLAIFEAIFECRGLKTSPNTLQVFVIN